MAIRRAYREGALIFYISGLRIFFNSSTVGGNVFFWITAVGAFIFISMAISLWYRKKFMFKLQP
ncbi:hypothetical protein [Lysinibacillus xylanilyticus]|uniref:hypothetical protein n=1 Tax=Lysinibacillus xylanilyticus TaxID=582475 RepID=UPI002B252259|nr:hypothetical protein [Lysinibacillus xylanilyticus]